MSPELSPTQAADPQPAKKIAIYIVAQDAVGSLTGVLDRIPERVRKRVDDVFVCDAGSRDDTYLLGVGYKAVSGIDNLHVVRTEGRGPGASNKEAIAYCRERGYDIVVLLHADGKYDPEAIESLIAPLLRDEADAVFGSRFLERSVAGTGMPLYKYLGVRLLSALQNRVLRMHLSEHHCGYRAYSVGAVAELPYRLNSDQLHFDTELTIQMKLAGLRIVEVPVPVYTGDETRSIHGVVYALNVLRALGQYWLHVRGLREYPKLAIAEKYAYKTTPEGSHQKILALLEKDHQRVLDVGCGAGFLAEALAVRGNTVVGVDARRAEGVEQRTARFLQVDLDREAIPLDGEPYSCVVLADVLEHLRSPEALLRQCRRLVDDGGILIISVPNVAHWSVRASLLFGRFRYTARGILDRSHLRFYTLATIRDELDRAGFVVDRIESTTVPLAELFPDGALGRMARSLAVLQRLAVALRRELFAYQFVLRCRKRRQAEAATAPARD